jgi:hypothetical protein
MGIFRISWLNSYTPVALSDRYRLSYYDIIEEPLGQNEMMNSIWCTVHVLRFVVICIIIMHGSWGIITMSMCLVVI